MGDTPAGTAKPNRLKPVILLIILAGLVYLGGRWAGLWGPQDDGQLKLYGNVEIREVQLGFRVGGRISKLYVDEGDRVAPGQLLAELDTRPLDDRLAGAAARLDAASAAAARDANGSRPQEVGEARASVAAAEARLLEARRQFERRQALVDKGFISKADVQTAEAAVAAAQASLAAARNALSLAEEGVRSEDRAASEASRNVAFAERRAVQTDIFDARITAAEPGQVLTRAREIGAIVQPGQTVLTVALTQPVRVRAYVAEPDLPKVRPGMAVTVSVDGSDKRWPAKIGYIAPVAEFTPKTVQTEQLRADLVYRLRLTVDDPQGELRQGQPVTVTVPSDGKR
ncbi:MAG: efflux RND transporter periplasmic adaptor subunit [Novosphingobium sp.]|jgi:HlyD family secretion protein|uniref:efflux RND transporter periplasmic adaptor subunit n=1 Tax=Novosphingobium sp. TaxID=1874826 RepID=UPI00391D539C|nr:HlyD family efflux transporter periplasmic adaptor subunit [Novosphingobium sp.]